MRRYAQDRVQLEPLRARERAVREAAEAVVRARLGPGPAAPRAGSWPSCAAVEHRERSRYWRSEPYATCRVWYREVGARLVREGALEREDDVFDLTS